MKKAVDMIRNCSNCMAMYEDQSNCGVGGAYVCENHRLVEKAPLIYISSILKNNIKENISNRAMISNVNPFSPYFSIELNENKVEQEKMEMATGNAILLKSEAMWVFGLISTDMASAIKQAMANGIPVYYIDRKEVFPNNRIIGDLSRDVRLAMFHNNENDLIQVSCGEDNDAFIEYFNEHESYRFNELNHNLHSLSNEEREFLGQYLGNTLGCSISNNEA